MSVELQCTAAECDSGEGGQRWKSQPLPDTTALQMLDRHLLVVHDKQVQQGGGGGQRRDEGVANLSGKKYHAPPYLRDAVNKILTIFWSNGKDTRGGLEMVSLIPTGFEIS